MICMSAPCLLLLLLVRVCKPVSVSMTTTHSASSHMHTHARSVHGLQSHLPPAAAAALFAVSEYARETVCHSLSRSSSHSFLLSFSFSFPSSLSLRFALRLRKEERKIAHHYLPLSLPLTHSRIFAEHFHHMSLSPRFPLTLHLSLSLLHTLQHISGQQIEECLPHAFHPQNKVAASAAAAADSVAAADSASERNRQSN